MRKTGIVAASVVLALTVVGCGSKESGTPVSGGSGNTSATGSAGGEKKDGINSALDLAAAIDSKGDSKKSAKITFDMSAGAAAGESFKGEGAFSAEGASPSMKMTMDMGSAKMEMVLVDKVLYMKMPSGVGGTSAAKPWVKITPGGSDPLSKQMGPMLDKIDDSFDIDKQLDQIKSAGTIDKQEKTTLDGEEVTHYEITIDTAKMAENATDQTTKESAQQLSKAGVKSFPMEWWINSDNLPVKITSKITAAGQSVDINATYKDWGKPVEIKAPPASQVASN
ncbi:hypothetical protein [Kibdelosporangium phytohabitans]|uniref:LppX_LprAFG lipoprotein n=1 Tax=Kibdelosporangium phytohabitans TaxID=860235 RepID=A0A0N9I451_9PSEU|nr:hypothetical protein [Kibdelosporangium phytohabitans]ALG13578.1 hypothetical protein AOZ06_47980 [Kibdelosporangium phytohabitans]MBE1465448.1 hypothetical protein [Kibdelosporangium phytohabitans]